MNLDDNEFATQFRVLDWTQSLERVGGDEEILREIAALFLDDMPAMVSNVREAVAQQNPVSVEKAAHYLKGSVANFGAQPVFEAALALERAGRSLETEDLGPMLMKLEDALHSLTPELEAVARR